MQKLTPEQRVLKLELQMENVITILEQVSQAIKEINAEVNIMLKQNSLNVRSIDKAFRYLGFQTRMNQMEDIG